MANYLRKCSQETCSQNAGNAPLEFNPALIATRLDSLDADINRQALISPKQRLYPYRRVRIAWA